MILMLRPRSGDGQSMSAESFDALPATDASEYVDVYGNLCQRIVGPPGEFRICATANVRVADAVDAAPGLLPTPVELLPDACCSTCSRAGTANRTSSRTWRMR